MNTPDRPILAALVPPRRAVRAARLMIRIRNSGGIKFEVGRNFSIGRRGSILSLRRFVAGEFVSVGQDFLCETDVIIGSHVLIPSRVSFIGNDHDIDEAGVSVYRSRRLPTPTITLEGDNFIGNSSIIIGSVTIGRGTVVGAGSLVTSSLPAGWVCYGRPARPVRRRGRQRDPAA